MNIKIKYYTYALLFFLIACEPDLRDDPIPPPAPFPDIIINTSLPQFTALQFDGGIMYHDGGVRGLIIYRENASRFRAFERNCSYQPNEACALVEIHPSNLYLFDACCSSSFNLRGEPTGGVAWRPLREYKSSVTGTELRITDDWLE